MKDRILRVRPIVKLEDLADWVSYSKREVCESETADPAEFNHFSNFADFLE